ncbi:MAG: P-II family nitrogen regulator [Sphaerochaetaceae bacterium]
MSNILPVDGKLLLSIVRGGLGEDLVKNLKENGSSGSTIVLARGVIENPLLHALSLDDAEKEIVFTLVSDNQLKDLLETLSGYKAHKRHSCGLSMVIDIHSILRHDTHVESKDFKDERSNTMDSPHTLITCIVNKGLADEVMDAARKAGATGGTIVGARGTGKEEDVKFFGIQLVPEKEMLLILVGSGLTGIVLETISKLPCLAQPGSGIAYCTDVERFMVLGGKKTTLKK